MRIFLTILYVLILFIHTFAQVNGRSDHFTFRQGVTLNHWTSMPIQGWTFADPKWFGEKDVEWIAATGIDHLQLYVSVKDVFNADNSLNFAKLEAVDSAIAWTKRAGLGIILTLTPSQLPDSVDKQTELWGQFAQHFKSRGGNVRFLIGNPVRGDSNVRNSYYQQATAEIRRSNPKRTIYLTATSTDLLAELRIPENDHNIAIAARMAQWQMPEAIDVFLLQHSFENKPPLIAFPSNVPNLKGLVADSDDWAVKYFNARLDEKYLDVKFRTVSDWMNRNHPGREFYLSHWRYVTGWPFVPESVKDEKSIVNFGRAFRTTTRKNHINWSVYDYNSGSPIRYPNGEKALILTALGLQSKRK